MGPPTPNLHRGVPECTGFTRIEPGRLAGALPTREHTNDDQGRTDASARGLHERGAPLSGGAVGRACLLVMPWGRPFSKGHGRTEKQSWLHRRAVPERCRGARQETLAGAPLCALKTGNEEKHTRGCPHTRRPPALFLRSIAQIRLGTLCCAAEWHTGVTDWSRERPET